MAKKNRVSDPAVRAAKLASAKRLCAMYTTAQQSGTLRPVTPAAQPIRMEMRVKSV